MSHLFWAFCAFCCSGYDKTREKRSSFYHEKTCVHSFLISLEKVSFYNVSFYITNMRSSLRSRCCKMRLFWVIFKYYARCICFSPCGSIHREKMAELLSWREPQKCNFVYLAVPDGLKNISFLSTLKSFCIMVSKKKASKLDGQSTQGDQGFESLV